MTDPRTCELSISISRTDPQSRLFSKLGASEGLLKENSSEFQGDSPTDSKVGLRSKLVAMTVGGSSEKTQFAAKASGRRSLFLAALGIGVLLGLLSMIVFSRVSRAGLWDRVVGFVMGRPVLFDVSSPTVVEMIRQLSRLETVEYSLDKIVEGERQSAYLPDFLAGDKLLLVAHGEVIAGVDLGQLKAGDVRVNGDSVHVRLPAAQIFTTRIDNARTRVYSRSTGLLVASDPNLESNVRQAAEQQIAQAALDDGIVEKARQNAGTSVTALLYRLGFRTVDVK
jgi:hypothetical protein